MIDCEHLNRKRGDPAFRREEYWGVGPYFLIHYYGDHTVFKGFKHRNSKSNTNQFVTTAPYVKEKVKVGTCVLYTTLFFMLFSDFKC